MRKKELSNEHKLILLCARIETNGALNQEITKLLNTPLDWDKIIAVASSQRIMPFTYYNLSKFNSQDIISLPHSAFLTMKSYYYANLQRNLTIEKEISRVLKITNFKGLGFVPFKGLALLQSLYSRNPGLRIMDDVDILIKKNDFQEIHDILVQSGYCYNADTKTREEYQYEFIFSKTLFSGFNLFIEIHTMLNPSRPYEFKLPCLWQRLKEGITAGEKTQYLSPEDMFLSLATHLRRHTRRMNLKFIIDIAELLNSADKLDWQYIMKSAKDNHIVTTVYFAIYLSQELFSNFSFNKEKLKKIFDEFRPGIIKRRFIRFMLNKHNFFSLKRWQGTALRFLLFDRFIDFFFYLWQVSLWERILHKIPRVKRPIAADENTRK